MPHNSHSEQVLLAGWLPCVWQVKLVHSKALEAHTCLLLLSVCRPPHAAVRVCGGGANDIHRRVDV